jgi:hypothetical protein
MNAGTVFMLISVLISLLLGSAHLIYTLWVPKLVPRDAQIVEIMRTAPLLITNETTLWRAWVGFNVSHSMALLMFGAIYGYLAIFQPQVLRGSVFLQLIGLLTLAIFAVLSKKYWFSVPFVAISVALVCFAVGIVLAHRAQAEL